MAVRFNNAQFIRLCTLYPQQMQEAGGITTQVLVILRNHALTNCGATQGQPVTVYIGMAEYLTFGPKERLDESEDSWVVRLYTRVTDNISLVCRNGALTLESHEGHGGSAVEYTEDHKRYSQQIGELLSTKAELLFPGLMRA
jgi:hypothetical protein